MLRGRQLAVRYWVFFGGLLLLTAILVDCRHPSTEAQIENPSETVLETKPRAFGERVSERQAMVDGQLKGRDINDLCVINAMLRVPRHYFVPVGKQKDAYGDHPLPIGHQQTISQPYIVAYMTQALRSKPGSRVLEIGTGSGYQSAVLAEIVDRLYTIEIVEPLALRARGALEGLDYQNIEYRVGDGYQGWPEAAPFDGIIVTAAPPRVPEPLLEQLKVGGVMIIPVGTGVQDLVRITRNAEGYDWEKVLGVRFVPMTGRALKED